MTSSVITRSLAVLLILCILVVGGIASAQSITHESQHAHHQKSTHGTVLCTWMCAAGHVLDIAGAPYLIEESPVAFADQQRVRTVPTAPYSLITSRGPPVEIL